jgi:processive 1,2-diacylglycerol beta-glucosyltransferase
VSSGSRLKVFSASSGAGHIRAFAQKGTAAEHIEVLQYTNKLFRKMYADTYIDLVNRQPELLGILYNSLDHPWKYQKRRLALDRLNMARFVKMLKADLPSFALCTHFLPAEILLHLRKKKQLDIPVGIVVTDIDAHAMWLYKDVDMYFVAHEETRHYLAALGIPAETIHVTGIPIDPVFAEPEEQDDARRALGLESSLTTILISAGGFGVGPVEALVEEVQKLKLPVQVAVICGRNEELAQRLSAMKKTAHPMKVVGYTTEMDRWMAASDLLVSKAGGLTSSEALARELVMVIVNPIPGQEERNSDHFLEEGVAIRCNNVPALAYKIDNLLEDPEKFATMKAAVKRMARPTAAEDIASLVLGAMRK